MRFIRFTLPITLLVLITYVSASAQVATLDTNAIEFRRVKWYSGVIVKANGGSIKGYMPKGSYEPKGKIYYLPSSNSKKLSKVKIKEVRSMNIADLQYKKIQLTIDSKPYMCLEAVKGEVSLYIFREYKRMPLPIPIAGSVASAMIPYDNTLCFLERKGKITQVDRYSFKDFMSAYLKGNSSLVSKIKDKTYKYRDMNQIITEYNQGFLQSNNN